MTLPLPEPTREPTRPRRLDAIAAAILLRCGPIARLVSRLDRRQRGRYSPGIVVVSVDRSAGDDEAATRLVEWMVIQGHGRPRWLDGVEDPGATWRVTDPEGRVEEGARGIDEERGHWNFHTRALIVAPGTEALAMALVRLASRRLPDVSLLVTRWPRFELAAPLSGYLTPRAQRMLGARARDAGSTAHRVAVLDTPFAGPPGVNVVESTSPLARKLTGSYPHGAAVCSLIIGASPLATIDHYPVLRAGRGASTEGRDVLSALGVVRDRALAGFPVDVVNLSLTTPYGQYPDQDEKQLDRILGEIFDASAGATIFVAATGNDGGEMGLPARLARVIGVGCTQDDGTLWARSAGGRKPACEVEPDGWLVAAGVGLVDGEDGTSFAAASVSGLLARAISNGTGRWQATVDLLEHADRSFDGYSAERYGAGRVLDP